MGNRKTYPPHVIMAWRWARWLCGVRDDATIVENLKERGKVIWEWYLKDECEGDELL